MNHHSRREFLAITGSFVLTTLSGLSVAQNKKRSITIEVGHFTNEDEKDAWFAYGIALAGWAEESGVARSAPEGVIEPSFEGEYEARRGQIQIWTELTEKKPKFLPYMDQMLTVQRAGFLKEYVWYFHRRDSWLTQPYGLRMADFLVWLNTNLANHQPFTGARLRVQL